MTSTCCDADPLGEIIDGWAFCSDCREHAEFIEEDNAESGMEKLADCINAIRNDLKAIMGEPHDCDSGCPCMNRKMIESTREDK